MKFILRKVVLHCLQVPWAVVLSVFRPMDMETTSSRTYKSSYTTIRNQTLITAYFLNKALSLTKNLLLVLI